MSKGASKERDDRLFLKGSVRFLVRYAEDLHEPAKGAGLIGASAQVGFFHHGVVEEVLGREARKLTSQDWWSIKGRRLPAQR